MNRSFTTMDYLVAKAWLKKTGQWGLHAEMMDGPGVAAHAMKLYYEATPEYKDLWSRIEQAFKAVGENNG